jgi:hypothetical protein
LVILKYKSGNNSRFEGVFLPGGHERGKELFGLVEKIADKDEKLGLNDFSFLSIFPADYWNSEKDCIEPIIFWNSKESRD